MLDYLHKALDIFNKEVGSQVEMIKGLIEMLFVLFLFMTFRKRLL